MKNSIVGRIDHSECDHSDTSHARRKCRAEHVSYAELAAAEERAARRTQRRETAVAEAIPEPPRVNGTIALSDLRGVAESLEQVEQELMSYAAFDEGAISLTLGEGSRVTARYDRGEWTLTLNP